MADKKFYCYIKNGKPNITETKPDNFDRLKFKLKAFCRNEYIAKMLFKASLSKMKWDLK